MIKVIVTFYKLRPQMVLLDLVSTKYPPASITQACKAPVILSLERQSFACLFLGPDYPGPQCHISARKQQGS